MKTCNGCKHAEWVRNAAGNLHPSGRGRCTYQYKLPELPACMYWISTPSPSGGFFIDRKKELEKHCVYWSKP